MDSPLETLNQDSGAKKTFLTLLDDLNRDELKQKCKGLLAIAQKAKLAKSELENEIEKYKIEIDKYESEQKTALEKNRTLQELVDSLTEQKLDYITEVDTAQNKIKSLNAKCKHYEEEICNYKAELIIKEKHAADTAQQLSNLDSEVISLKRQHKRLLDENEQLITQLGELEAQTTQFNNIGLEQREQLKLLEDKMQAENIYKVKIEELNNTISELQLKLQSNEESSQNKQLEVEYEDKIKEITLMYESEKSKKEKANVKLRSYKDKILKCAACINQLKNSRFILSKTVKDYSEIIPKWQNDIINASKVLDTQINQLNNENSTLKEKLLHLEKQFNDLLVSQKKFNEVQQNFDLTKTIERNDLLQSEISDLQERLQNTTDGNNILKDKLKKIQLEAENKSTIEKRQLIEITEKYDIISQKNEELSSLLEKLKSENDVLRTSIQSHTENYELLDNMNLQIKALETEKTILLKEKLSAKDSVVEFENENKLLKKRIADMRSEIQIMKSEIESLQQQKTSFENKFKAEKEDEINNMKCQMLKFQEQHDLLKKEYDNLQDLNGLLKEEVETLKLSLEQPKDDAENLSDLNVSLQADLVKLETKLSAYKQENASLLAEIKESRSKAKEFDALTAEYEEAKSKLSGYKTENAELLNEMKEINQVLKERGEAISKLQKAITELERLVETLEKDRDSLNQEKDDLNKGIEDLKKDLKNAELTTGKSNATAEQVVIERNNALKLIAEKDMIITSLHDEIEKFKQQQMSHELPHEDMSTSTISKAEEHSRMKDLDETFEEKYTKLRLFALKLKKKLNETITQLQNAEQAKANLEKLLQENDSKNKKPPHASNVEIDGCNINEEDTVHQVNIAALQAKLKNLTATVEASEQKTAELEKVKVALENKSKELAAELEAHRVTKDNLEKARRDAKKKNVLSLEMEDYERSMKELTVKMEETKKKMVQMESTIDTQEGTITAMKTQIKLLEEQIKSEETQSRLTKEELQHAIEEGKEKDDVVQNKNGVILKLEQDLEDEKRKNEESALEMTALVSEKEKVIMALGEDKTELNSKVKRLEFKCSELNEKLRITNIELADLKTEYTSYKVRAQAVLRQNQTVDHSQEERLKEEAAALKAHIETITMKLASSTEQYSELSAEAESLRRRAAEAAGEAARAQQRTARLQADLTRIGQQLDSERTHHKLQVSTLTQCYKTQISELEERLQKETEALKKQLVANQETAKTGKNVDEINQNQYMLPVIPKDEISDGEMDINVSMIPREEGEGSESAPSPPPSKPYLTSGGSGRSPVPLERLLEEGVPEDEALDTASLALTADQEIADLKRRLQAQQQRVKHVTVLLSESERECARLAQLSDLLKAELRRVRAATHNAHNTEYMKNVTLKFLTLAPGDERSRLVPVLQKILTLTPDETLKIQALAKGQDPNQSKGWGSYLPWPGGK